MIPQVPPPDPASDFGIERTARMNIRDSIAGHGMRETGSTGRHGVMTLAEIAAAEGRGFEPDGDAPMNKHRDSMAALSADDALAVQHDSKFDVDDLMAQALAEDLAGGVDGLMLIESKREMLRRHIAQGRVAMAKKQDTIAMATAELRQLKASVRADEDALDSLLASEA